MKKFIKSIFISSLCLATIPFYHYLTIANGESKTRTLTVNYINWDQEESPISSYKQGKNEILVGTEIQLPVLETIIGNKMIGQIDVACDNNDELDSLQSAILFGDTSYFMPDCDFKMDIIFEDV